MWNRKNLFWREQEGDWCGIQGLNSLISVLAASEMTLEKTLCQLHQNLQTKYVSSAKRLDVSDIRLFAIIQGTLFMPWDFV